MKKLKIKNDKDLERLLKDKICVPIYYSKDFSDKGIIYIDEEGIREEFENKLVDIMQIIKNKIISI